MSPSLQSIGFVKLSANTTKKMANGCYQLLSDDAHGNNQIVLQVAYISGAI